MWRRIVVLMLAMVGATGGGLGPGMAAAAAEPPPGLTGATWELVTLQAAGQPAESVAGTGMTIAFGADGRVGGTGGCNQFGGTYTADASGQLSLGQLASTLRLCAPPISEREARYLATLPLARRVTLVGTDGLQLGFDQPNLQLVYKRATPGVPATGGGAAAAPARVTGTVTYLQRIALPPSAIVQVQLVDRSRADAPAIVIAEQTITPAGQGPPYAFALPYETTQIAATNTYGVQARITVDGELRFISTQAYLVITQGRPTADVAVVVDMVGGGGTPNLPSTGGGGMAPGGPGPWSLVGLLGVLLLAARAWPRRRTLAPRRG